LVAIIAAAGIVFASPALGHQPVDLDRSDSSPAAGPLLVDGTVSFAVRSEVAKPERRGFRFRLANGDTMRMQLLIEDKAPDNRLRPAQLPRVVVIDPEGRRIRLAINERTRFYEPYGRTTYWYLSRVERRAVPGTYRVVITGRAKVPVDAVVAVGYREVPGEVLD
jgi:hypothetical protein